MEQEIFVNFLNAYSALIQAIATVVLVALTLYYVKQAKKSATELERTRKAAFIPLLSVDMEATTARSLTVSVKNIGHGLAQHPKVSLPFEEAKRVGESLEPGGSGIVTFENVGIPEILELPELERKLRVEYGDIFGRVVVTEAVLVADIPEDGELTKETISVADWRIIQPEEK